MWAITVASRQTWGLAQSWFIPDYTNWSNVDFERAKVTTWTMIRHDGPNHLGLRCDAILEHQMALITSVCAQAAVTAPLPNNTQQADYFTQTQSWHGAWSRISNSEHSAAVTTR